MINNQHTNLASETEISNLRVDYISNPLGIDNPSPSFSWKMISDLQGQKQTAYRIRVSKMENGSNLVWDSDRVADDVSVGIKYAGDELISKTRYYWTLDVWDVQGNISSDTAWFETAMLNKTDWNANFIAYDKAVMNAAYYSIELDFTINQNAAGIIFGAKDASNFLMWQINNNSIETNNSVYLRPHKWLNGKESLLDEIDISDTIPFGESSKQHHLKITVSEKNEIVTYIDLVEVDRRIDSLAQCGMLGFREYKTEAATFDNIVYKNDETNEIYLDANFDDDINVFGAGKIINGGLYLSDSNITLLNIDSCFSTLTFRKTFFVEEKEIEYARLYSTSLGIYEAYINNEKVGIDKFAPGWTDYISEIQYQTFDVTNLITKGANTIGAIVGNGWYSGRVANGINNKNKYGADKAFLGQLEIFYKDGTSSIINTDNSWKVTTSGPYVSTDNQDGETYDARLEIPDWNLGNYNDSDWNSAKIATKDNIESDVNVENVALIAQTVPISEIKRIEPISIIEQQAGIYIVDFGQNFAGWINIKMSGNRNEQVRFRYGEMLYDENATPLYPDPIASNMVGMIYTENLRTAKATDYYTFKDNRAVVYEPRFTFHGFRYLEITGLSYKPSLLDIKGIVVGSIIKITGNIETSNQMVNQLYSNIYWGQLSNYFSIPSDCPQRDERCGWTADTQAFAMTGIYNADAYNFLKKYCGDMRAAQESSGSINDIAPDKGHIFSCGNAGWGDAATIVPWTLYQMYGEKEIIIENYTMMKKWVDYCLSTANEYIIPTCLYGDWLAVESTPKDYIATAFFAYSTHLFAQMAEIVGNVDDATTYGTLFENIKSKYNEKYVSADGTISNGSQASYVLALKFDLLSADMYKMAAKNLSEKVLEYNDHLSTGFLGTTYINTTLTDGGYSGKAYDLLLQETYPSWLYSVLNGATTVWERWNSYTNETGFGPVEMNSFNHYAYGAIGEWMYRYMGGIQCEPSSPGFKKILIMPFPDTRMSFVNSSYDSIYGKIESNWTYNDFKFNLNIKIPANTTASIAVPADDLSVVNVPQGATFVRFDDNKAIYKVESGKYSFESTYSITN